MKPSLGRFSAAIGSLRPASKIEALLREILTPGEFHDLALRWEIVELLVAGVSQRQIASQLGVSLCKITRGAKILKERNGIVASLVAKTTPKKAPSQLVKRALPAQRSVKKSPAAKKQVKASSPRRPVVKKTAVKSERTTVKKVVKRNGTRVAR